MQLSYHTYHINDIIGSWVWTLGPVPVLSFVLSAFDPSVRKPISAHPPFHYLQQAETKPRTAKKCCRSQGAGFVAVVASNAMLWVWTGWHVGGLAEMGVDRRLGYNASGGVPCISASSCNLDKGKRGYLCKRTSTKHFVGKELSPCLKKYLPDSRPRDEFLLPRLQRDWQAKMMPPSWV